MKKYAVAASTVVTIALMIAGCNDQVDRQPVASASPSTSGPSSRRAFSKAPAVTEPLDATKYLASPCASLTAAQYQNFQTKPGVPGDDKENPNCAWMTNGDRTRISISYMVEVTQGLSGVYAQNDIGFWKEGYFEPAAVDSYPAVYASIIDSRANGKCQLNVGINDNEGYSCVLNVKEGLL